MFFRKNETGNPHISLENPWFLAEIFPIHGNAFFLQELHPSNDMCMVEYEASYAGESQSSIPT